MRQEEINTQQIALIAVMSALVLALTTSVRVQTPIGGYVHLGDIAIYFAALAFGPVVGGIAGGLGAALADAIGFPLFIVSSLIVHGLQGYVAGRIGHGKTHWSFLSAAIFAGSVVLVLGYFIAEAIFLGMGPAVALEEVVPNIFQALAGAVGVPVYLAVRRAYPPIVRHGA